MSPIRVSGPGAAAPRSNGVDLSFLRKTNPKLDEVIRDNPGVLKLIERMAANGGVVQPKPTDAKSKITFEVWTHSKKSGGMPVEPFGDVIFVWQNNAPGEKGKVDFGGYQSFDGKLIGVFRLDQLAYPSAAAAKDATGFVPHEFAPGKWCVISDDKNYVGSYEWQSMPVTASGPKGANLEINWAIVGVGPQGNVLGGGFPGGWSGRTYQGTHGKDAFRLMPDH